ncbi:flavin-containing monooxygenase [Mycobacterium sp. NPDC003323]
MIIFPENEGTTTVSDGATPNFTEILADPDVHGPSLLMSVSHMSGNTDSLTSDLRPIASGLDLNGELGDAQMDRIRKLADAALQRYWGSERPIIDEPSASTVETMLRYQFEGAVDDPSELTPLIFPGKDDPTNPIDAARLLRTLPRELRQQFAVAVIGAGMSGILAAICLQEAEIPFVILEKNADVGGTWLENTYPGCRCDVPNSFYSYSFGPNDWSHHYSPQPEILDYFQRTADAYGIRQKVRYQHEVTAAKWADSTWSLTVRDADGAESQLTVNAVISAVGQLNRPSVPDITGAAEFAGPAFHSAAWRHDIDLTGKRVAVIGTGASAMQFVPEVARVAGHTMVFQRNAPWIMPNARYRQPIGQGHRWLLENAPYYRSWYRLWLLVQADARLEGMRIDPDWEERDRAANAVGDEIRRLIEDTIRAATESNPDLASDMVPTYPYGANRRLIDDGTWLSTMQAPNVSLVTCGIEAITPTGVRAADGTDYAADVIVYGTGFASEKFLWPMEVTGRNDTLLTEAWKVGGPRAYLGTTLPDFPNLFILYGPNTNLSHGGSIIFMVESQMRYLLGCLQQAIASPSNQVSPTATAFENYNRMVDEENRNRVWGDPEYSVGWYKAGKGRVFASWPLTMREFQQQTSHVHPVHHDVAAESDTDDA